MTTDQHNSRRAFLARAGALGVGVAAAPGLAETLRNLRLPGGPSDRAITTAFPQKGAMILQRTRPPLLETPFEVFDTGVFTPNDRFYVRWHWAVIPTDIDTAAYRLKVDGHVGSPLALSLADLLALPRYEIAAVNQCSGNSRGLFEPRVAGAQWANGSMGNARWTGVRLKDVLDRAGIKPGATVVRFSGLDEPLVAEAPDFQKSLAIDHARDGEVMVAFAMNGEALPLLNGYPLRLVVPGWYSTYWIKMLDRIEVLDKPDDNYWMAKAYTIPDTPHASIAPGTRDFPKVPINRMIPRSFVTNLADGAEVKAGAPLTVRGIAFGGDSGVARVDMSSDGGATWQLAKLGPDMGKYSFRRWDAALPPVARGPLSLLVRCTSTAGAVQPVTPNWNPSGFMRNVIETTRLVAA